MTPAEFIAAIAQAARTSMAKTRIPASFTIAEAALESGWGKSGLVAKAFNLFGVKADASWHGPTVSMETGEHLNGKNVVVPALWRKYPDWQACIDDHAAFLLKNKRYGSAFSCTDGESFSRAIAAAGYATDPAYADKIIAVMRSHQLAAFDKS